MNRWRLNVADADSDDETDYASRIKKPSGIVAFQAQSLLGRSAAWSATGLDFGTGLATAMAQSTVAPGSFMASGNNPWNQQRSGIVRQALKFNQYHAKSLKTSDLMLRNSKSMGQNFHPQMCAKTQNFLTSLLDAPNEVGCTFEIAEDGQSFHLTEAQMGKMTGLKGARASVDVDIGILEGHTHPSTCTSRSQCAVGPPSSSDLVNVKARHHSGNRQHIVGKQFCLSLPCIALRAAFDTTCHWQQRLTRLSSSPFNQQQQPRGTVFTSSPRPARSRRLTSTPTFARRPALNSSRAQRRSRAATRRFATWTSSRASLRVA
jgi:hypothetical protein